MGSVNKAQRTPITQANGNLFGGKPIVKRAETQVAQPISLKVGNNVETKELGRDLLTTPTSAYAGMVQFSQPTGVQTAERCLDNTMTVKDFAAFQGGNFKLQNPQQAAADLASLNKTIGYIQDADKADIEAHMQKFEAMFA